ncbi:MAG: ABC transporter permease, partial [Actinophytocola sp.]|nr:ABC transporter permease [Actinophytocola sp.]
MRERAGPRWLVAVLAAAYAAPLGLLVLRATADTWRAPAVWPQALGWRGVTNLLHPGIVSAVVNSLVVAVATTVLAVVLGWGAARVLAGRDRARRRLLYALVALPLLVPPYAVGVGLGGWFVRWGLVDSRTALMLAHLVYVLPYVVLVL